MLRKNLATSESHQSWLTCTGSRFASILASKLLMWHYRNHSKTIHVGTSKSIPSAASNPIAYSVGYISYPVFIEPRITLVPLVFSGYIRHTNCVENILDGLASCLVLPTSCLVMFWPFRLSRVLENIVSFANFVNSCMTCFFFEISATGRQWIQPSRRGSGRCYSD